MEKILISACLCGDKCRYDGKGKYSPFIKDLLEIFELIPFCSEVEGGLRVPRIPSERKNGIVVNQKGVDVTRNYQSGAEKALTICKYLNIKTAILKERSPACGVHQIHDGSFSGKIVDGKGVTTELLEKNGVRVISEEEIEDFLNEYKQ